MLLDMLQVGQLAIIMYQSPNFWTPYFKRTVVRNDNLLSCETDGESGIQVKETSCAASIQKREEELPHSPCTTGRGSNQITAKPINATDKLKQIDGKQNASTHRMDLETQAEDNFVEFQGENYPRHKEGNIRIKFTFHGLPVLSAFIINS